MKYCIKGKTVLDVGCGDKWIQRYCNADLWVGVDIRKGACDVLADAEHLPFKDNSFDIVLAYSIIEHVKNPYLCMKEWLRVAKECVLLWTDYPLTWNAETDPTHLYCWSPKILRQFLSLFNVKTSDWVEDQQHGNLACVVWKV